MIKQLFMLTITVAAVRAYSEQHANQLSGSCNPLETEISDTYAAQTRDAFLVGEILNGGIYHGISDDYDEDAGEDDEVADPEDMTLIISNPHDHHVDNFLTSFGLLRTLRGDFSSPNAYFFEHPVSCYYNDKTITAYYDEPKKTMLDVFIANDDVEPVDEDDSDEYEDYEEYEEEETATLVYRVFAANFLVKSLMALHKQNVLVNRFNIQNVFQTTQYNFTLGNLAYIKQDSGSGVSVNKNGKGAVTYGKFQDYKELANAIYSVFVVFKSTKITGEQDNKETVVEKAADKFFSIIDLKYDLAKATDATQHFERICTNQERYKKIDSLIYFCKFFKPFIAFLFNQSAHSDMPENIEAKFDDYLAMAIADLNQKQVKVDEEYEAAEDDIEENYNFDVVAYVTEFISEHEGTIDTNPTFKSFIFKLASPFIKGSDTAKMKEGLPKYTAEIDKIKADQDVRIII